MAEPTRPLLPARYIFEYFCIGEMFSVSGYRLTVTGWGCDGFHGFFRLPQGCRGFYFFGTDFADFMDCFLLVKVFLRTDRNGMVFYRCEFLGFFAYLKWMAC